jgi:hypothetical protein
MPQVTFFPDTVNANPNVCEFSGIFRPDTASTPTKESGRGVTVAHQATGLFRLTIPVTFNAFLSYQFCIGMASAAELVPQVRIKSVTNRTIDVAAIATATDTDIAANANNAISYTIKVVRSGTSIT